MVYPVLEQVEVDIQPTLSSKSSWTNQVCHETSFKAERIGVRPLYWSEWMPSRVVHRCVFLRRRCGSVSGAWPWEWEHSQLRRLCGWNTFDSFDARYRKRSIKVPILPVCRCWYIRCCCWCVGVLIIGVLTVVLLLLVALIMLMRCVDVWMTMLRLHDLLLWCRVEEGWCDDKIRLAVMTWLIVVTM